MDEKQIEQHEIFWKSMGMSCYTFRKKLSKKGLSLCQALREARAENERLRKALEDALYGWNDAAQYKGEYLYGKHGDYKDIERLSIENLNWQIFPPPGVTLEDK